MIHMTLLLIVAALLACSAASAATIHVPDPDLGIAHPSQAIAIAQPGDVIEISGTSYYSDAIEVAVPELTLRGVSDPPVKLLGRSGGGAFPTTPYTPAGPSLVIRGVSGVVLENLSLQGGAGGSYGTNTNKYGYSGAGAVECIDSTVRVVSCQLGGGVGGDGAPFPGQPWIPTGGSGGPGLTASDSEVLVEDSDSEGGMKGAYGISDGCAYRLEGSSRVQLLGTTPNPADPQSCVGSGAQLLNQSSGDAWLLW